MKLYRAIVENNLDPDMLAKVQVRIAGIHTDSKIRDFEGSITANLPWAEVIGGTDFGLINGVGTSSVLQVGTMVWLLLEDDDPNRPIIIGVIKGITAGESDINRNAKGITDGVISKKNSTLDYLESAQPTSVYPENHVIKSASGHMIELDDSPGQERVQVIDKNGNYSEMNLSAYIDKAVNDKINVVLGELKEHIVGKTTIQSDSDVTWNITGDFKINVSGNILMDAGASVSTDAGTSISTTAGADMSLTATGVTVSGGPDISMTAGIINLN